MTGMMRYSTIGDNLATQTRQPLHATRRHGSTLQRTVVCLGVILATSGVFAHAQDPGRKVAGTVVAAATQLPVHNARVQYKERGQSPQTTTTDAKGYFEFTAGRRGVVTVTTSNFGTARRQWPPNGSLLSIALMPPAIVNGAVTDLATGRLVPALVSVMVQHLGNFVSHTVRAERGTFEIADLPPGPALLTARSPGFAPFIGSTTVEGGKVRAAQIGLLLEAQASGHVIDAAGNSLSGAFVMATYPDLAGGGILEGFIGGRPLTGSDGAFELHNLVPDRTVSLQAELGGHRSQTTTIRVAPGTKQLGIVITLP